MDSIWNHGEFPSFPALEGDTETEVLILGGGAAGLLTAYFLHREQVPCLLVEQNRVCGGVTGRTTAKITAQHGLCYQKLLKKGREPAEKYLHANLRALEAYEKLCENIDCDFLFRDNFVYSVRDSQKVERELEALEKLGYPAIAQAQCPIPVGSVGAVGFPRQAQFHPLRFFAAIARGLNIREHTKVEELVGTTAVTDRGRIRARRVIVATHFPFLNKHGSYFLKLYQHRSYVLALENASIPEGMYVDEQAGGLSFRGAGDCLLLGGGGARTGKNCGGWEELRAFAGANYPGAREVASWATQDCMSLDHVPYIGRYSARTPDLFVAAGFNKWGMTGSMVAAMLLRDEILGKKNDFRDVFDPSRSILHPQLLLNGAEAAAGLLFPTGKRCPHLGCALKWNPREQSWDCSCHGSRFTEKGRCLDNPATGDLPDP